MEDNIKNGNSLPEGRKRNSSLQLNEPKKRKVEAQQLQFQWKIGDRTDRRKYTYKCLSLLVDFGGLMYRTVFTKEAEKASNSIEGFLTDKKDSIEDYFQHRRGRKKKPKLLSEEQLQKMFPNNSAATSAEEFDITLLAFLVRNICPSFKTNSDWQKKLDELLANDVLVIHDLIRLREFRNEFMHTVTHTPTAFDDISFKETWDKISEVLVRLGQTYTIPNLEDKIANLLYGPLDSVREEELQEKIKELEICCDMDSKIVQVLCNMKEEFSEWRSERPNLYDMTSERALLEDEKRYFVETNDFADASKKLLKERIVILEGNAGEGKTTMANMLLFKLDNSTRVWKMKTYEDWPEKDLRNEDVVIIDDIFGSSFFYSDKCMNWRTLPFTQKGYVIITSRNYILDEARQRAYLPLYGDQSIVQTISLNEKEKKEILSKHLKKANREADINECLKLFEKNAGNVFPIGFPECCRLFCSNEDLFEKGPGFFEKPYKYIRKSIHTVFQNGEDVAFPAFFLIWATQGIKVSDLELSISSTRKVIIDTLDKLQVETYCLRQIRRRLNNHSKGLIQFDRKTGVYTFKHRVIADVVGILSYELNATAVFECCDLEFALKYFTTEIGKGDSICVVEQYQYNQLSSCLAKFLVKEKGRIEGAVLEHQAFTDSNFCRTFLAFLHDDITILSAIVSSEKGVTPSSIFLEDKINVKTHGFRMASYSIWKKKSGTVLADKWFKAFTGTANIVHSTYDRYFERNEEARNRNEDRKYQQRRTQELALDGSSEKKGNGPEEDSFKAELYLSAMLAIKYCNEDLLKALIKQGANVTDDMIILAWSKSSHKEHEDILQYLCRTCKSGNQVEQSTRLTLWLDRNPLIPMTKRGHECAVIALLKCNIEYGYLDRDKQYTALHFACKSGQTKIAMSILKDFKELDIKDKKGYYPIHYATRNGDIDTVETVLDYDEQQADRTLTTDEKWLNQATLLHIAVDIEHTELIRYLVGKREFLADNLKRTPFMFALKNGKFTSCVTLVQLKKVDKVTPDEEGNTPLHIACERGWLDIVDKLLEDDSVKIDAENKLCRTPMQLACENSQYFIVSHLQTEICRRYYSTGCSEDT